MAANKPAKKKITKLLKQVETDLYHAQASVEEELARDAMKYVSNMRHNIAVAANDLNAFLNECPNYDDVM